MQPEADRETRPSARPEERPQFELSSLGLIAHLIGSLGIATLVAGIVAIAAGGGHSPENSWSVFLIASAGIVRAFAHRRVGHAILFQGDVRRAIRAYVWVAMLQVAFSVWILVRGGASPGSAVASFLPFVPWPLILLAVTRMPAYQAALDGALSPTANREFAGASTLMLLFGVLGIGGVAWFGFLLLGQEPANVLLWIGVVILFARSVAHARAGLAGVRSADGESLGLLVSGYVKWGYASTIVLCAVLLLSGGIFHPMMFVIVALAAYILLMWPLLLSRFFDDRLFAESLASVESTMQSPNTYRGADAGLVALGWVLLAAGGMFLAQAIANLFSSQQVGDVLGVMGVGGAGGSSTLATLSSILVYGLQVWAGVELILMSARYKLASTAFAITAIVSAAVFLLPTFSELDGFTKSSLMQNGAKQGLGILIFGLPALTLWLVHRARPTKAIVVR